MIVWGIVGWKNSGKTSLVTRLVVELSKRGLSVSTIKHAHHVARVDHPGTDTDQHRQAGARQVVLASDQRWALMTEAPAPDLGKLIDRLDPVDMVLVEGFKKAAIAKIECHRAANAQPLLVTRDPLIRAVATDADVEAAVPVLPLDGTERIADFLLDAAHV